MALTAGQNYTNSEHPTLSKIMEPCHVQHLGQIILALLAVLAAPAASFARMAGQAGAGNVPIGGIPSGPANAGGMNNVTVDPSGIGNASRIPPLSSPRIGVPAIPHFK